MDRPVPRPPKSKIVPETKKPPFVPRPHLTQRIGDNPVLAQLKSEMETNNRGRRAAKEKN